jgi:hypothetical protein
MVVGFLVRVIGQPTVPYGFHRDEAAIGYSAYSVLFTARDEWGKLLPLHFRSLGDYPPGVYNYLTAISILLFGGLSETAERAPAIFFGTLLIGLNAVFVYRHTSVDRDGTHKQSMLQQQTQTARYRRALAVLVAWITAIAPWEVVQSRAGGETVVALVFALCGWLCWESWVVTPHWKKLGYTLLCFLLSIYTYNAVRVALPLIFTGILLLQWQTVQRKRAHVVMAALLWGIAVLSIFGSRESAMTYHNVSIVSHIDADWQALTDREALFSVPLWITRLLHNKVIVVVLKIASQYCSYFSPSFLLFDGGYPNRYLVPEVGQLLLALLPFLALGLTQRGRVSNKTQQFFLTWLLLAPVVGAITTTDTPHVKRALFLFLPFWFFTASGLLMAWQYFSGRLVRMLFVACVGLALGWNLLQFTAEYSVHTAFENANQRSYGWRDVFAFTEQHLHEFDNIVVFENNDAPYIFYLFYTKFSPTAFQRLSQNVKTNIFTKDKKKFHINQYTFDPASCPPGEENAVLAPKTLYVSLAQRCTKVAQADTQLRYVVYTPDRMPKFVLYTRKVE